MAQVLQKPNMADVRRHNVAAAITVLMRSGCSLNQAKVVASEIIKSRSSQIFRKNGVIEKSLLEAADEVLTNAGVKSAAEDTSWVETVQPDNKSYTDTGDKVTSTSKDIPPKTSDTETKQAG
jgi:hypothetical protein